MVKDVTSDNVQVGWSSVASGPMILQNNERQRLWFFTAELAADDGDEIRSPPCHGYTVQLFCNQRYLSMRGAR